MKTSKILSAVVIASAMLATVADAGSIGRSGGGSSGGRSSFSSGSSASKSSSFSAPSKPTVAPAQAAPAKPGGIGGNTASMGVRKSEVTAPAQAKVDAKKAPTTSPGYSNSGPTYGSANTPSYGGGGFSSPAPAVGGGFGGGFGSSFAGALGGSILGNMLFSNHGSHGGGTTVINNGVPSAGSSAGVSSGVVAQGPSSGFDSGPGGSFSQPVKKEYTMWSFIGDLFGFVIVVALLVGIAFLFYKGYKMVRNYVNRERGVGPTQPFSPTQQFWSIQRAFSAADVTLLQTLLGPDLVDEATNGLTATTLTLHNVSHEVVLQNPREFSVHYTFEDAGAEVNQVWHYELHDKVWKLNGIENL